LKVLEKFFSRRKALKRSHFSARNLVPVIHKKELKDLRKSKIETNFIQEDRDRAIASGLMKNKFIPGASKAEEKKRHPSQKKKRKPFRIFFT
jgi:hypothetical protein